MLKNKRTIFIFLGIFSFSLGLWENYKSVWLEINQIRIDYISYIISTGLVLSSFIAILTMVLIKNFNIARLIKGSVVLRIIAMFTLCCCFKQDIVWLKVVAFLIESIASNLIVLSIYPLITQNLKTGKIYSKKKLLEYVFTDLGIFVAGIVVAFQLADNFEYNVIAIISAVLTFCSLPFALMLSSNNIEKKSSLKNLFKDKICNLYLFYLFIQQTAYYTALGLTTLLLKNLLGLSINFIAVFLIVTALAGDLFGYLALYKLNFKNDYLSYSCKFVLRFVMYVLIACTGNLYVAIIGIAISLLVSRAWENVSDGVYVNRVPNENQLLFLTFRYGVSKLGGALGVFICGTLFNFGIQAIFGVSAAIMFVSIVLAFLLIHLRNKEKTGAKRITLVACFNDESNQKIENKLVVNNTGKLCKVPYNIANRIANDNLPYHITLSAWNADKKSLIVTKMKKLNFNQINCDYEFNLMDSTIKGNILYLNPLDESKIKTLQVSAYNLMPTERYNPLNYKIHATINIDENQDNNLKLFSELKNENLSLTIDRICLFEIYPVKLLQTINLLKQ